MNITRSTLTIGAISLILLLSIGLITSAAFATVLRDDTFTATGSYTEETSATGGQTFFIPDGFEFNSDLSLINEVGNSPADAIDANAFEGTFAFIQAAPENIDREESCAYLSIFMDEQIFGQAQREFESYETLMVNDIRVCRFNTLVGDTVSTIFLYLPENDDIPMQLYTISAAEPNGNYDKLINTARTMELSEVAGNEEELLTLPN